ncbi:MAG: 3-phosphoshikimate 1-carboxyvinyltransferase [Bacteroidetes bacterium ADurb.Bin012]|nr:MAG: 3-phosphoshikimate 1-carboxyvinyltransferase [Bacteroidetes bacterium ADurb.Bin012]
MNRLILTYRPIPSKVSIQLPYSKSISNRLLIIQALAGDTFEIAHLSDADDTRVMAEAIRRYEEGFDVINVAEAGTAARFLTAYFALRAKPVILTGSGNLLRRPISALVNTLRSMGAMIEYLDTPDRLPLHFKGGQLHGGNIQINADISSQFVSALLMIAPMLPDPLNIHLINQEVSMPYVDLTIQCMRRCGAKARRLKNNMIEVDNSGYNFSGSIAMEPDWSSAAPWFAISALQPSSEFLLENLDMNSLQADKLLIEAFKPMGVVTTSTHEGLLLKWRGGVAKEMYFDFRNCPDIALSVIVTAAALNIDGVFANLSTLRFKETDRYQALKEQLLRLGIDCAGKPHEGLIIRNRASFPPSATIFTYHDHRMALAFAPLACIMDYLIILEPQVINKSYPSFWEHLGQIGIQLEYFD